MFFYEYVRYQMTHEPHGYVTIRLREMKDRKQAENYAKVHDDNSFGTLLMLEEAHEPFFTDVQGGKR